MKAGFTLTHPLLIAYFEPFIDAFSFFDVGILSKLFVKGPA
jgi:hypothetical protein